MTLATYDVISRYHNSRLSPNFAEIGVSGINKWLLKTAYVDNNLPSPPSLVRPRLSVLNVPGVDCYKN